MQKKVKNRGTCCKYLDKVCIERKISSTTQPELASVQKKKTKKKKKQEVRAYAFVSEYILHFL